MNQKSHPTGMALHNDAVSRDGSDVSAEEVDQDERADRKNRSGAEPEFDPPAFGVRASFTTSFLGWRFERT